MLVHQRVFAEALIELGGLQHYTFAIPGMNDSYNILHPGQIND